MFNLLYIFVPAGLHFKSLLKLRAFSFVVLLQKYINMLTRKQIRLKLLELLVVVLVLVLVWVMVWAVLLLLLAQLMPLV